MTDDKNISTAEVQALATRDGVVGFFAALGYRTDSRQPQSTAAMGITASSLERQIRHIERVAVHDDGAEPLDVYLIELTSVTVAATHALARALRNRAGNYLLALTDDYERIDFVLLQRYLRAISNSPMTTQQVAVRPRALTVNRRDPTQVQLRVLRRFTYTEADSDAQYDKLLSAYTVADWSEPLYNNRALFSDYYLNERLPELSVWRERPEDVYHLLRETLDAARQTALTGVEGKSGPARVDTALAALGFSVNPGPGGENPDYRLYAPDDAEKPVAACLAYPWNRYLDGRDETRDTHTPDENPGARVVTVLESGEAPWAIVTNGKLWRLYSARTHSRSSNYYEIDLEETLAMEDPNRAFRYFWLFFRLDAFLNREVVRDGQSREMCFLDEVLADSEEYAKRLGERLKERVFERIFSHFAKGFIEHLRGQAGLAAPLQASLLPVAQQLSLKREPDEEYRRQVFQGTLTLLYRLLFLLYAESRGLLPVREVRGYREESLTKLKEDVAKKAGNIADDVPNQLRKAYGVSAEATGLYDRLLALFEVIDRGSRDLNVPLYNGGLFVTSPANDDHTPEAEAARFLAAHKIPDRYLALGLDQLARDLDDKRQDLVFIDYKSLGVRQLGSIYEGLLEFKVRIAQEKMAVVKGKKTEEVIPYGVAGKSKQKVLTTGRGRNAEERVYNLGDVYLENDRRERKASGSYYTPDHIVKYIVENTVGPVLAEKFEKLRPRFREAQRAYSQAVARAQNFVRQGMRPDDPAKVANSYEGLVDDLFDVKVLDPAMGSGHFLVEAVDFICDRILGEREGLLRAFPWNPVTKYLQDTREAIIAEMERQGVTVDTSRLTDINLLKRHVLKRCVYGVDLNPMAVELAKVSLWLDCFTIGAPLSFLDHHLKCGNSLIGTTVQEVESELAKQQKGHVASLFGGPFQGLLAATATIEELRRIPDATVEQAERSSSLFAEFEKSQAPYKKALHIWVSRHFGNKRAQEYLTLAGPDLVQQINSGGKGLSPQYQETIGRGAEIGKEKRFFHWDLEFPEAFVDLQGGRWKPKEERGFDAVVGNPPYDVLGGEGLDTRLEQELAFYREARIYAPAVPRVKNLYKFFVCRAITLLARVGSCSFIVPMSLLGDIQTTELRKMLLEQTQLQSIEAFPQKDDPAKRVFPDAKLSTAVFVTSARPEGNRFLVRTHPGRWISECSETLQVSSSETLTIDPDNAAIPACTQRDWEIATAIWTTRVGRLGDLAKCFRGDMEETAEIRAGTLGPHISGPMVLRGANITLYTVREASQGEDLFLDVSEFLERSGSGSKAVFNYGKQKIGYQRSSPQNNFRRLIAAPISPEMFCFDTVSYVSEGSSKINLDILLALLNSKFLDWYFRLCSTNSKVNEYQFNNLPVVQTPDYVSDTPWGALIDERRWDQLEASLLDECSEPGFLPGPVAAALAKMCRQIQRIEASRTLKNRSERSPDIPHIKPEVSKEPTILYVDDCTDAPERCQTRYRAYWTTFWCGGWWSIGWESHLRYTMAPFQPLQTRTSPLVTPHHLR